MRKLGIVALGAAAALTLAGCASGGSGASDDGAEIRVWLVGTDTPAQAPEHLGDPFEKGPPGSTLVIEEQSWDGLVDRLTTSLSGSDSPHVVEGGKQPQSAFTSAGAFLDLTDKYEELGGDDLLPGFVEAGSYDGKFYAAPLYSGARLVFYKKDALAASGLSVPTTLDEYIANGEKLAADNPGKSGIWWPGQDWYNALPYIWENGGEVAVPDGDAWDAQLSSEESLAGLAQVQQVMTNASRAPKDGNETSPEGGFCDGTTLQLGGPTWVEGSILPPADARGPGAPEQEENLGVYALPGLDGGAAQVFAGGSNIGVSAKAAHPAPAGEGVKIILSDEFQTIYGENGLVPAKLSLADTLGTDEVAQAIAAAAGNAKLTPASPKWADVEAAGILQALFVNVARGGDAKGLPEAADEEIEAILNS